jgi:hypothetical protein
MAVSKTVHMRALRRAAQSLGGVEALRAYLQVPMGQLAGWLHGEASPPQTVFLRVVDLLAEDELTAIKQGFRDQSSAA